MNELQAIITMMNACSSSLCAHYWHFVLPLKWLDGGGGGGDGSGSGSDCVMVVYAL